MQKIMFNDRYGLEQAVIAGTKTMTRRRIHFPGIDDKDVSKPVMGIDEKGRVYFTFDARTEDVDIYPKYQIGEQVAVAQSYASLLCGWGALSKRTDNGCIRVQNSNDMDFTTGDIIIDGTKIPMEYDGVGIQAIHTKKEIFDNKMFVRADLMPHIIEITDIKVERLRDISGEDCLREGITKWLDCYIVTGIMEHHGQNNVCFDTPRAAFAALIDRLNGRGTWQRNEWQFAYTFKLIK